MTDVHNEKLISEELVSDILSINKTTLKQWVKLGKLKTFFDDKKNDNLFNIDEIYQINVNSSQSNRTWEEDENVKPLRDYKLVELFAGAGGLALGLENAGLKSVYLNEKDKDACATLKLNRPEWNVVCGDIANENFTQFRDCIDIVSGGFPCQAFSYAGNKLGFEDTRGTLFFEFARAIKEINPKIFIAENVRGLLNHDNGKTLSSIKSVIDELGYELVEPKVLKAIFYKVPQKRERLILVAIRKDIAPKVKFLWPAVNRKIYTLKDALKAGELFTNDVPDSPGQIYPELKKKVMDLVPEGGYWRNLPEDIQKTYMKKSYFLGGGKTGMARRLAWNQPSLTLTCAPAQNQTERCHPEETRPLKTREYARIQTFPDNWVFTGSVSSIYKQIGNAVPVNLSTAIGRSLVRLLNDIETL